MSQTWTKSCDYENVQVGSATTRKKKNTKPESWNGVRKAYWMPDECTGTHNKTKQNERRTNMRKKKKKRKRRNRNINIEWIFLYHSDDKYVFVLVRLLYWEIILHFQVRTLHVYNKSSRHTRHNAEKKKIFIIHIERRQEERTPHISTQVKMKREKNEKMFFVRIHCDKRNIYMSCLLLNGYGLV